jgi:hypothetical protein
VHEACSRRVKDQWHVIAEGKDELQAEPVKAIKAGRSF